MIYLSNEQFLKEDKVYRRENKPKNKTMPFIKNHSQSLNTRTNKHGIPINFIFYESFDFKLHKFYDTEQRINYMYYMCILSPT